MNLKILAASIGLCASLSVVAPALAAHLHPAKATKFQTALVVAYAPCVAPDTTHDGFVFPACLNPAPASNGAHAVHFGPKGSGQVTLAVTGKSELKIVAKITDVRDPSNQPFTGSLSLSVASQLTDGNCAGGLDCTVLNLQFPVTLPCSNGTCKVTTTASTAVPGLIPAGVQANVAVGPISVLDPDGKTAFVSGLFIP